MLVPDTLTDGRTRRKHNATGCAAEAKKTKSNEKVKKMKLLKTEERASERNWRKWASVSAVILHGCPAVRCSFYVFIVCVRKC